MAKKPKPCEWVTLEDALRTFVLAEEGTQSSSHIPPRTGMLRAGLSSKEDFTRTGLSRVLLLWSSERAAARSSITRLRQPALEKRRYSGD